MMERLLVDAGIGEGMRVLDVGCGYGEVSFLVARLTGAQGQVVGIDRDSGALVVAQARARERELGTVSFVEGDLRAPAPELLARGPFDAVVGRRVLMYQRDPSGDAFRRRASRVYRLAN